MKKHLLHRLHILEGERRRHDKRKMTTADVAAHNAVCQRMEGIREALELIDAWETEEANQQLAGGLT